MIETQHMKIKIYCLTLLFFVSVLYSCNFSTIEYQKEFETSLEIWLDFKKSSNNSYQYKVATGSWTGTSWETTVTVENGIVIQRDFEYTANEGAQGLIPEEELKWTETGIEIGTHKHTARPLTLDDIYTEAQEKWLIKRKETTTFFNTENAGIISTCGYVEDNCADDCFKGIKITSLKAL